MYNVNVSLSSEWPVGDVSVLITVVIFFPFVVWGMALSGLGMLGSSLPQESHACLPKPLFLRMPESMLSEGRMVLRGDAVEKGTCRSFT